MEAKQSLDDLITGSSLRVIEVDPQTDLRWEAFMTSIPASTIYYHPAWLQVLEEAFSYKPVHLACEDATGRLVGILPLFYRRGWRTGRSFTSVFTGPLAYDDQTRTALIQAAVERTSVAPGARLHLGVMSNALDDQVEGMVGVLASKTYLLALPERPDLLRLDPSIKRAVNKATKLGVQVRQAETERELRAWYELYVQTMRKFGVMPDPYHLFEIAWQRLHPQGLLRLLMAERIEAGRRRLLAGFFLPMGGQTISYARAGWREEDQALRPNDVLHWQVIQDACTDGFRWYDFGDVELDNQGLARYKRKWGAEAKMIYAYSYPAPKDGRIVLSHDQPEHSVRQLASVVWQHLPVKVIGLLSSGYHALHF